MIFQRGSAGISANINGRTLRIHSSRPQAEAERLLAGISSQADSLLICGAGLGYLIEQALAIDSLKTIFVYEPNPELAHLFLEERPELNQLKEDPRVVYVDNLQLLPQFIRDHPFSELAFVALRSYHELFSAEIEQCHRIFASALTRKEVSRNTLIRFGRIWVKNFLRNLPYYQNSFSPNQFIDTGAHKPALVIGAGPSLDEALPFIKDAQKKAVLIAVDTALPMLEKAGINVDFVVTVDPQEINAFYLRLATKTSPYLVADPGVHPSALENYADRLVLCGAAFPFYSFFEPYLGKRGILASGGSVSTSAFDFARTLGCDPILLVGQDLAFSQKKTHGLGNILWNMGRVEATRLTPYSGKQARSTHSEHTINIMGRQGSPVLADARLASFAAWFSEEVPKTQARVFLAGLEGAAIDGTKALSIPEAFALIQHPIDKPTPTPQNVLNGNLLSFLTQLDKDCGALLILAKQAKMNPNSSSSQKLQEALSAHPACARLVEVGMQDSVWKTLETGNSHSQDKIKVIYLLAKEIEENLSLVKRALQKSALLMGEHSSL
ncbi:MAG: motility associated factor glycosyltransferase family protein [Brevinema sp.]